MYRKGERVWDTDTGRGSREEKEEIEKEGNAVSGGEEGKYTRK